MKIGSMTIEILKDLITFQKIAIWSKDAIIECSFVPTNISLQVACFYIEYSGVSDQNLITWKSFKLSMEDFDKPALKLEMLTLICMSFTLLMLGRAYFILMCICEIKTKTKTWHEAVVQLTSYKKCLDACNHYLPSWKETLNVT